MSKRHPINKPCGTVLPWERMICEGKHIPAQMLHLMLWLYAKRIRDGGSVVLRFTEQQFIDQALGSFGRKATVRKWLRWFVQRGLITVTRDSAQKLKGRFPDRAARITVNADAVERLKNLALDPSGGFVPDASIFGGETTTRPCAESVTWQNADFSTLERSSQQVQNSKSSRELPCDASVVPSGISGTRDPLTPSANEEEVPPSKTMGTPFQETRRRGIRGLVWNIAAEEVPNDPTLKEFARSRWCMALAGLFRIYSITQRDARHALRRVSELTIDEMLWAQTSFYRGHREPWMGTWDELIAGIRNAYCRQDMQGGGIPEREALQMKIMAYLARNATTAEVNEVRSEMLAAKVNAIPEHDPQRMHEWAAHWRDYMELWDKPGPAAFAAYAENRHNLMLRAQFADEMNNYPEHEAVL